MIFGPSFHRIRLASGNGRIAVFVWTGSAASFQCLIIYISQIFHPAKVE